MRTVDDGAEMAAKCWAMQYNCAESVLRGVCHGQEIELSDQAKRMATPFGGGVGRSEDVCGALMGGVLAIGLAKGRTKADEDRYKCYDAASRLRAMFIEEFGSNTCRILNKSDFKSPEHKSRCGRFVDGATRLAIQILRE